MFANILKYSDSQPRDKDGQWTSISFGGHETGWSSADPKRPLSAADTARANSLKIRTDLTDVQLSRDPEAGMQAIGKDAKGRTQYKFSAAHHRESAAAIWDNVRDFHKTGVTPILERANRDMNNPQLKDRNREVAAVVALVGSTGFRIGSTKDTKADEQAYGISTLERRHFNIKSNGDISINFTGKSGVTNSKSINDPQLAKYLLGKIKGLTGTDRVFPKASDSSANDFIKSTSGNKNFSNKDFRTWHGTGMALKVRKELGIPTSEKEAQTMAKIIAKRVAAHLGNTPAVAMHSYIAPFVFDPWVVGPKLERKPVVRKEDAETTTFAEIYAIMEEFVDAVTYDKEVDWTKFPAVMHDPDDEDITIQKGFRKTLKGY